MSKQQLASYATMSESFASNCYLVVDIGGGTVDISAHQLTKSPDRHVKVIHPPAGNDFGGSRVNKEFRSFLEDLVVDPGFKQYISSGNTVSDATHNAHLNELINETFETQKRIFGEKGGKGGKVSIRLPFSFMTVYQGRIETGIQRLGDSRIELTGTDLRVEFSKVEEFYKPVVAEVLKCMAQTLEHVEGKIETIYIVGGFGGCNYLYSAITERFGEAYKYVTPAESDFAVVRGAVIFRRNPEIVESRRADATYGVRASIPFVEDLHDEAYKQIHDGQAQCTNIFSTFIEVGDIVSTKEVMVKTYKPENPDQPSMHVNIYTSPEKDIWYTTGKRPAQSNVAAPAQVYKVGELIVPLREVDRESPRGADEESKTREVEVVFDFSHTEIQVKGFDKAAKCEVKVVLDFLSS